MLAAGVEMLRESSYADLTVRAVAARAKVAPATAYTYFSSKNHLIAEVYLDLVRQVPYFTDVNESRLSRVEQALREHGADGRRRTRGRRRLHHGAAGGGNDPAVRRVRERIGAEIHRRITVRRRTGRRPAHGVGAGDDVLRCPGSRGQSA